MHRLLAVTLFLVLAVPAILVRAQENITASSDQRQEQIWIKLSIRNKEKFEKIGKILELKEVKSSGFLECSTDNGPYNFRISIHLDDDKNFRLSYRLYPKGEDPAHFQFDGLLPVPHNVGLSITSMGGLEPIKHDLLVITYKNKKSLASDGRGPQNFDKELRCNFIAWKIR